MNLLVYTDAGMRFRSDGSPEISLGISIRSAQEPGKEIACEAKLAGHATTVLEGEYLAAIEGLKMAREMGATAVIFCTDSLLIAQAAHGVSTLVRFLRREHPEQVPPEFIVRLLHQRFMKTIRHPDMKVYIRHVGRENNYRADTLARSAFFG